MWMALQDAGDESALQLAASPCPRAAAISRRAASTSSSSLVVWSCSPPRPMPSSATTPGSARTRSATPSRASRWAPSGIDSAMARIEVAPFEDRLLGREPLGADQPLGQAAGCILGYDDSPGSPHGGDVSVGVDAHGEGLAAPAGSEGRGHPRCRRCSGLGARVARAANSAVRLELSPRTERYSSISARRLEKRRRRVEIRADELGRARGRRGRSAPRGPRPGWPGARPGRRSRPCGHGSTGAGRRGTTTGRRRRAPRWRRARGCAAGDHRSARSGGRRRPPPVPRSRSDSRRRCPRRATVAWRSR